MAQRVRQVVWDAIDFFFSTPQPGVCVQCHRPLGASGYHAHLPKENIDLEFCSQYCGHKYWADYKRHCEKTAGRSVCSLPGCNKPCYQEGRKVHDYCGRTHAKEHKAMMDGMERDRRKHHFGGGGSGGGGFSSGNSSYFKRTGPIKFYNRGEPYYEFTNFYEVMVVIDGKHWSTTEHYFQAQKFVGTPILETIRMLSRPREAFDMSRNPRYSRWRRPDWEEVKEDVMYKALQAKFSQHENLRQLLLETGKRELIEHSPHDSYWGDGGDGTGKNRLGALLVKLRDEMKAGNSKKKHFRPSSSPHPQPQHLGMCDKQPISVGNLSADSGSKPADRAYSSQAQGGGSGGAGPYGQPSKPDSPEHIQNRSQESGHTYQQQHAHQAKEPIVSSTDNPPPTDAMVIANTAAMTQQPPTSTPSFPVTFTPSPHSGPASPSTTAITNTPQLSSLNQSQMPYIQALGISGSNVPQGQQPQPGLAQGHVAQPFSAGGTTHMTQWSTNQPPPAGMSSGMMTPASHHPLQNSPGHVGSNLGTTGLSYPQNQQIQSQGPIVQASGAMGPSHAMPWNTNQPSSTVVMSSGTPVMTAMPQQPLQHGTMQPGHVGLNRAPLGAPGSHFPQNQQQPFATPGSVPQPTGAMGPGNMAQLNANQLASNVTMPFSTTMTTMSQPQQHIPMRMGPVGSNLAPPPGFTQPSGGTQFPPPTSANQFSPIHLDQRGMLNVPNGAHPGAQYPQSTAHTVAGGGSVQGSFQSGMHAQQATLQQQQHNCPGNNGHDEPQPMDTSYI